MASYDIIGGIVDPKVLKELQDIEKIANNIAIKLRGVTLGSMSKEADAALVQRLNAETTKLITQEQKLQAQIEKTSTSQQNKAKNTKILTGYINELEQEVKQLAAAYSALSKAELEGTTGQKTLSDLKGKREELAKLKAAYGDMRMNVGNYSSATKMLGINIGQVMKEMPNFAISARIGIMSLTNNLPMLAETIKAVRLEQLAMIEAGKKAPSMFSLIAKSVFGLTGVMSILMVLLQVFGADIIKWVGSLFKGADAVDKLTLSQRSLINTMNETSGTAKNQISNIIELGAKIRKYGDDSTYSKDIIDEFNKTFDTHYTSMVEIKNEYPKLANAAIQAAIKMAAADKLIQDASTQTLRGLSAKQTLGMYSATEVSNYKKNTEELFVLMDKVGISVNRKNKIFSELATNTWNEAVSYFSGAQREMLDLAQQYNDGIVNEQTISGKKYMEVMRNLRTSVNDSGKGIVDDQKKRGEEIISALFNEQGSKVAITGLEKAIDELYEYTPENKDKNTEKRARNSDMRMILGWMGLPLDYEKIMKKVNENIIKLQKVYENPLMKAIDTNLNYAAEAYEDGIISYEEFENLKTRQLRLASEKNIEIIDSTQKRIIDIEQEAAVERMDAQQDLDNMRNQSAYDTVVSLINIWQVYFDYLSDNIDKQLEKDKEITDEKIKQYEDETDAGMHTKAELSDYQDRMDMYRKSQEEQAAKDKEEIERNSFLVSQALAVADIWIKYAQTNAAILVAQAVISSYATPIAGAAYAATAKAMNLASAVAGTALAAAQTIPYFAEGGIMENQGMAVLGDAYKHELAISPSGQYFVSDNKPTMYNLEKGTQILPDINRMDLASILALKQGMPEMKDNVELLNELKKVTSAVKSQKHGNFYGMPLIRQIENRNKYSSRSKSLMN